jgi:hypothetical protein
MAEAEALAVTIIRSGVGMSRSPLALEEGLYPLATNSRLFDAQQSENLVASIIVS